MVNPIGERERFFVIAAGRTGSSLLAAILAEAGADWGMPAGLHWDESKGGSYEYPDIVKAAHFFRRAHDYAPIRPSGLARWPWAIARHRAKSHLRQALDKVRFVKAIDLDLAVQAAFKLGYFPRIIVNYRAFADHAISLSQMYAHRTVDMMERDYVRTYRNALVQLHLYGGCVVGFDELADPKRSDWADSLATVTGYAADRLLTLRQKWQRATPPSSAAAFALGAESESLFHSLNALAGRAIPISTQALRNWRKMPISEAQIHTIQETRQVLSR